jgi:hypothetical protein
MTGNVLLMFLKHLLRPVSTVWTSTNLHDERMGNALLLCRVVTLFRGETGCVEDSSEEEEEDEEEEEEEEEEEVRPRGMPQLRPRVPLP